MTFRTNVSLILYMYLLTGFGCAICPAQQNSRVWSSSDSKFSVEAELLSQDGTTVKLKRQSDGKILDVPISRLSSADQEFVLTSGKGSPPASSGKPTTKLGTARDLKSIQKLLKERSLRPVAESMTTELEGEFQDAFSHALKTKQWLKDGQDRIQSNLRRRERLMSNIASTRRFQKSQEDMLNRSPGNRAFFGNSPLFNQDDEGSLKKMEAALAELYEDLIGHRKSIVILEAQFSTAVEETRKKVDAVMANYEAMAQDADIQELVEAYCMASGKQVQLGTSKTFKQVLERFVKLESLIIRERLPLRKEPDGSFLKVALGRGEAELKVDPTVPMLCFPRSLAVKLGLEPPADVPDITMTLDDGTSIVGKPIRIPRIRVGNLTALETEALVFEDAAISEDQPVVATLGLSFLSRFNFELIDDATQLEILDVQQIPD